MFIKQLKYDLLFSRDAFLGMGALLIGMALVIRMAVAAWGQGIMARVWVGLPLSLAITVVIVASYFQLFVFYKRSFFGDSGYLMLTLPIERVRLLVSKLVVSLIWLNFMAAVGFIMAIILASGMRSNIGHYIIYPSSTADILDIIEGFLAMNIFTLLFVAVTYFGISLSNSVIGKWRINGLISGVLCLAYLILTFWLCYRLDDLLHPLTNFTHMMSFRIVYLTSFASAIAIASATHYLLKNKVELQ